MASSNEHLSSSINLVDYFIYCPLFCEKEGQEERKILYYYPSTKELDQQIRTIGYCEGLVQFTETFGFDQSCESIHFQKTRLLFNKIENDIYLAMILHIPVTEQKKDDKCILEYHHERINDRLMLPILKISYRYFVLQYGTMSAFIQQYNVEKLRTILKEYFDKFIEYHLHKMIHNVTIDSSLFGIQFLSVDKQIYLKFQSILRRMELCLKTLKETMFIYRNQLVWSGLNQDDTTLLYSFFRLYYWPHFKRMYYTSTMQYFTVNSSANPTDELSLSTNITSQKFFLGNLSLPYSIIVIHYNLFTMFCVFYNNDDLSNNEKTSRAIELFQKDLEMILPSFDEYLQKKHSIPDHTVKNIYFNKINMAYSATIDWKKDTNNMISNVANTLAEDLQWFHPGGEVMVKRENDPWIVAKRSDMRELLLIINQKSANLKDIRDKIKQIFSTQFNSIFLLE